MGGGGGLELEGVDEWRLYFKNQKLHFIQVIYTFLAASVHTALRNQ